MHASKGRRARRRRGRRVGGWRVGCGGARRRRYREEGGGALEHVVAREVLRGGADGYRRVVDDQAHFAPLVDGVEVDAAGDEGLRQVLAPRLERVGPDCQRPRVVVGLEELDGLGRRKQLQEQVDEEGYVAVEGGQVLDEPVQVVGCPARNTRQPPPTSSAPHR